LPQRNRKLRATYLLVADLRTVGDTAVGAAADALTGADDLGGYAWRGLPSSLVTQLPLDESTPRSMHAALASTGDVRLGVSAADATLASNAVKVIR
jgi:hypothetical protein